MNYNDFKGLKISQLGFGSMRLPKQEDGKIDKAAAKRLINKAFDAGINYFDTAYTYHEGESELVMGELLKEYPRDNYYLATKMPTWLCKDKQDVLDTFQEQLKKCQVEYFDFYLIHDIEEESWQNCKDISVFNALLEEKAAGRIRNLGASFHTNPAHLEEILADYGQVLDFIQLQINYHDWGFAHGKEFYEIARKYELPLIIMEPLRGGMLAKLTKNSQSILDTYNKERNFNRSYAYYAFRYVADLDGVFTVLSGMSKESDIDENGKTFSAGALSDEDHEIIKQVATELRENYLIPCTACGYCYECPSEIKIKDIFSLYNESASKDFDCIWRNPYLDYAEFAKNSLDCIGCGNCMERCPQQLNIVELLSKVHGDFIKIKDN